MMSDDITFLTFTRTQQVRMQSMSSTMESAQIGGVCIFRTLPFLHSTGIIKTYSAEILNR